jgi:hypothetical protein
MIKSSIIPCLRLGRLGSARALGIVFALTGLTSLAEPGNGQ